MPVDLEKYRCYVEQAASSAQTITRSSHGYEAQLHKLQDHKNLLAENAARFGSPRKGFEERLRSCVYPVQASAPVTHHAT
jgi:hypothetical protein